MMRGMSTDATAAGRPNAIARLMGLERQEYTAVAWSFLYFFCLLSAYYVLRPMREAMAVASGPDTIPYLFTGTFVTMTLATPVFGWIASKYPRRVFLPWVYAFFIANILLFWAVFSYAIANDIDYVWMSRVFFVWVSVFNLYVVAVFWSFMADIYSRDQGRRLFGMITSGGSIGALIGGIRRNRDNEGEIVVVCDKPPLQRLLHTTGFDRIVPVTETLDEGTEFELIDRRPGWIHLRLGSGLEGWIEDGSAVTY